MTDNTVRDVPRLQFSKFLAVHMFRNRILECPAMFHNPENEKRFLNFQKWWFLEAAKLIIQWYDTPSLPPMIMPSRKDMTKEEKSAQFKNRSLIPLIKQYVELGWVQQDRTGIMIVTDLCKTQLDSLASQFRKKYKEEQSKGSQSSVSPDGSHGKDEQAGEDDEQNASQN